MARLSDVLLNRIRRVRVPLSRHGRVLGTYVFGSYAWGEPDADSDVDVAVFVEGVETWDLRRRASVVAEVQGAVGDDVELHLFPADALASPPRASLAQLVVSRGVPVE